MILSRFAKVNRLRYLFGSSSDAGKKPQKQFVFQSSNAKQETLEVEETQENKLSTKKQDGTVFEKDAKGAKMKGKPEDEKQFTFGQREQAIYE
jgi:hypothetical protein